MLGERNNSGSIQQFTHLEVNMGAVGTDFIKKIINHKHKIHDMNTKLVEFDSL